MKRPKSKGGGYGLPGGHVEKNETPVEALFRETREELGVILNPNTLNLVRTIYREKGNSRKIHLIFKVEEWNGVPRNKEPDKCKGLLWVSRSDLPKELSPTTFLSIHPEAEGGIYREDFDHQNKSSHLSNFPWRSELS